MKVASERKVTLTWEKLKDTLQKSEQMFKEEELVGITLKKPKQLLLYYRKPPKEDKGGQ